jgi:hypothetical protein
MKHLDELTRLHREIQDLTTERDNLHAHNKSLETSLKYWKGIAQFWADSHNRIVDILKQITNEAPTGKIFPIVTSGD